MLYGVELAASEEEYSASLASVGAFESSSTS